MVGCRFCLGCLIIIICVTTVRCQTTGYNRCGPTKIPCDDSKCIERHQWCDDNPDTDCTDGSDEKYCRVKSFLYYPDNECVAGLHFTCKNRMCIPNVLTCDGHDDCTDNSDEQNCDSRETDTVVGPGSPNNNSPVPTHPLSTEVPLHPSTTAFPPNIRPVAPAVDDYYVNRLAEEGNNQRPHYNPPTATASADLSAYQPGPTPDSRISPDSRMPPNPRFPPDSRYLADSRNPPGATWYPEERALDNLDRHTSLEDRIRGATTKEPCDETVTRSDDDPTSHYSVPWSHFVFESSHGDQIQNQYNYNARRAREWLMAQRDPTFTWDDNTPRALVALSLSSDNNSNLAADDILQRRLRIDLGAKLIRRRKNSFWLSASDFALYINAFIATCQNPRDLFEIDLVEMLYQRVQTEGKSNASPFPYLTLCLADRPLAQEDRRFLQDIAKKDVTDEISKDKFILATSTLACLKKTSSHDRELDRAVDDAFYKLRQQQLDDGSFGSVYSTALAAQALIAIDSRSWDPQPTLNYLSGQQRDDGSFGDFLATYYALPVLNGKSLLHLRNIPCQTSPPPPPDSTFPPPTPPPEPSRNKTVRYTLVTEKPYRTLAFLDLVVPEEYNFFDIMKKAQEQDRRFRFHSVEHDGKIDVYEISGIPNDPEFGLFWILYKVEKRNGQVESQQRYTEDIRNLIPGNSDELLFYYMRIPPGSW